MPTPLLLLAPAVALAAKGGSLKDLDKHNGFRDLALTQRCDDIADFKGNKQVVKRAATLRTDKEPYAGMITFRRPDDLLKVGPTELIDVAYACYMDQLMSVRLLAWGEGDATELLYTFTTAFGAPTSQDEDLGMWQWDAKKVVLTLRHDKATDGVSAEFTSKPMVDAKRENDEAIRKASVQDL
ncbi:MAG: hypothetical protein VX000_17900 [Myxococcota bacterium]|nr:hypothetical protein [Myxococcota bacterium]